MHTCTHNLHLSLIYLIILTAYSVVHVSVFVSHKCVCSFVSVRLIVCLRLCPSVRLLAGFQRTIAVCCSVSQEEGFVGCATRRG